MTPDSDVDRPVFVVGCGRSGTTVVYEALCGHPDVAWVSNYTARWPRVRALHALNRTYRFARRAGAAWRGLPLPSEGYELWDAVRPPAEWQAQRPLTEMDVTPDQAERAEALVRRHVEFQGAKRFLNKNTRNSRRIRYLNALFPDARFIHVIRDPRAAVASLLNVEWWPDLRIWFAADQTPKQWSLNGGNQVSLAAQMWYHEVTTVLEHAASIGAHRVVNIRYEDLMEAPDRTLQSVLDFVEIVPRKEFTDHVGTFVFRSANDKIRKRLTEPDIPTIAAHVEDLASRFGYSCR